MIVTVTERPSFKRCRWAWDWASLNRQGLTPNIPATALALGTIIHRTHSEFLDKEMIIGEDGVSKPKYPTLLASYVDNSFREVTKINNIVKIRRGSDPTEEETAKLWEGITLGHSMINNYETHWGLGGSLPEGFTLVQNEQEIVVPVPGTLHPCSWEKDCECEEACAGCELCPSKSLCHDFNWHGMTTCICQVYHKLQGQLDALIMSSGGQFFVLERKTFARSPRIEAIQQSDQMLAYIWLLTQVAPHLHITAHDIGGAVYDGMYKRAVPVKGKLLDSLFTRCEIIRPDYEISNFNTMLASELNEMGHKDLVLYNNRRDWEGCWDCSFEEVCTAKARGEDYESILAKYYVHRLAGEYAADD